MFNIVRIGTKDVPMLAMASTDIYYRNIFHEDPIKLQVSEEKDVGEFIEFVMKLGFVMAKFAEIKDRKEMLKLNEESYIEWLDNFGREDYLNALEDIQRTYEGQSLTGSKAKKNNEEPTGE